uniref:Receptor-like serine/threonine-protein kinase n=1 Tax=Cajanus cajan TaxID=3821 RepID=A0A151T1R0_CAJCA|nr:Putative serine/threonine-protein kinase receptor [Cajanus cajan]
MDILSLLIFVACILIPSLKVSTAIDTIHLSQCISDGMTLVSQGGKFEFGFFSPNHSNKHYLGIWYKNIIPQTVVWVAERAINDSLAILTVNRTGNLVLRHHDNVVWHTPSEKQAQNPVVQLLDSGNLVVREESETDPEAYLWQSFDYPSDTALPGMKLGWNLRTGREWRMTSWKSPDDPSPGDFYWGMLLYNYPEFYLMKGKEKILRIGPWNGLHFSGIPDQKPNPVYAYHYISNKDEIYYTYSQENDGVISRLEINQTSSTISRYVWMEDKQFWKVYKSRPRDNCDYYGMCGAYGTCVITGSQFCQCLEKFSPKSPKAWNKADWSQGCVRNKPLNCTNKLRDGFMKVKGVKLPDTTHTWVDETIGLEECRVRCLNNCSCMAYTNSDIRGEGSGCVMWFGDLNDIRQFDGEGQDLYIRMDASELGEQRHYKEVLILVYTTIAIILGMLLVGCFRIYVGRCTITDILRNQNRGGSEDDQDLPLVDLSTIVTATDNFSINNKIGEGGFGLVYKGRLVSGQEIAVKRLSRTSGQGMREFKNEVKLIAKLQHRNLVKLLACCVQQQDIMLVYEYMTNRSLDRLIFDDTEAKLLDWPKRFNIICGIARGLLYLHQDSRLRIIHRDLKASNVLIDDQLNPKISDFGIARIFGGDETEGSTQRVVGTYGYMAPEYAADGIFSVKSDVFSFGILMLEIISGKRSRGFYIENHSPNLVTHAWSLWKKGRAIEMIDSNIEDSCALSDVLRCIHVSLLCVQQHAEDRPAMPSVVLMLGSESELAEPKEPGFYLNNDVGATPAISGDIISINELTITSLEAR